MALRDNTGSLAACLAGAAWALVAAACGGANDASPRAGASSSDASIDGDAPADGAATPRPDAAENPDASLVDVANAADAQTQTQASGDGATPDESPPWIPDAATDGAIPACAGSGARYITDSPAHHFGTGQNDNQNVFPAPILGPPRGGGCCKGSFDVVSIGDGGWVVAEFAGNVIVDGPGVDFIVFENPFDIDDKPDHPYAEPGTVAVSQDGVTWYSYPCTATSYPYGSCAGWHPVFANPDTNAIDPLDPSVAGGDPYDLADVGLSWARYVRVTDRPGDGLVFDLDAMAIVHPSCP